MYDRFTFDQVAFERGRSMYQAGSDLGDLMTRCGEIDAKHHRGYGDRTQMTNEEHDVIEAESKGLVLGFMSATLDDLRALARGGAQRGQRA